MMNGIEKAVLCRDKKLRRIGAAMFVIYAAMLAGIFYMAGAK